MPKFSMYFTDRQRLSLEIEAKTKGIKLTELCRRIFDNHIDGPKDNNKLLYEDLGPDLMERKFYTPENLKALFNYQKNKEVHPLTCLTHSDKALGIASCPNYFFLKCNVKGCGYVQYKIPEFIFGVKEDGK